MPVPNNPLSQMPELTTQPSDADVLPIVSGGALKRIVYALLRQYFNKPRVATDTSSATPSINTDTTDIYVLSAQAVSITDMSENLTGTPYVGQVLQIWINDSGSGISIAYGDGFEDDVQELKTTLAAGKTLRSIYQWTGSKWGCMAAKVIG